MIEFIVATDENRGIGKDGGLPWHNAADMTFFRETTNNSIVIMGRRTWESIPRVFRPLKNRTNIVISRTMKTQHGNCLVHRDVEEALDVAEYMADRFGGNIFCMGGPSVYEEVLKYRDFQGGYFSTIPGNYDCDLTMDKDCPTLSTAIETHKDYAEVIRDDEQVKIIRIEV